MGTQSPGGPRQPYLVAANWTSGSDSPAHGTLNGIGQWFIAGLGGIRRRPEGVGYQHFELRPPWGSTPLRHASAHFDSDYGTIESSWSAELHSKLQPIEAPTRVAYNVRTHRQDMRPRLVLLSSECCWGR